MVNVAVFGAAFCNVSEFDSVEAALAVAYAALKECGVKRVEVLDGDSRIVLVSVPLQDADNGTPLADYLASAG